MEKLKKFVKKYISPELPMRLCVFNMMSVIGIVGGCVSILTTYLMKIGNGQVYSVIVAVVMLVFLLYLANSRKKLNLASILLCSIIGFIVFPIMFINGGGIYSGMPIWFMLVLVFVSILIEGKIRFIICGLLMLTYVGLIAFAYRYPEELSYFETEQMVFMDIGQSVIFVGITILAIISFQLYMYDLAMKKTEEAAREAEKAKEEAISANTAKSNFLANMSHEIRTPLGVIIGMNEMIQRDSNQQSVLDYSKDVNDSAKSLLSIINDILDFSKIESGKMSIVENEYEPASFVASIQEIAKIKSEEKGIVFETKIDRTLPSKLWGDDLKIKQCLTNLISNAFKYTEKGKIVFELTCKNEGDNAILTFSVSDTGRGIKEDEMDKLFVSFVRLEESKNRAIQGTGLGLNITAHFIEMMNGKLEVESKYGEGSKFYFTISQKIIDSTPIAFEKKEEIQKANTTGAVYPEAHVLVVDDSKVNLKVFSSLLKKTQINVDTAGSGFEAIEKVRNTHYDMIFMDHMMPDMDGVETFKKLREEDLVKDIPVIMLTANAIVGMKEFFLNEGFTDYLSKPIEFAKLETVLAKYLG